MCTHIRIPNVVITQSMVNLSRNAHVCVYSTYIWCVYYCFNLWHRPLPWIKLFFFFSMEIRVCWIVSNHSSYENFPPNYIRTFHFAICQPLWMIWYINIPNDILMTILYTIWSQCIHVCNMFLFTHCWLVRVSVCWCTVHITVFDSCLMVYACRCECVRCVRMWWIRYKWGYQNVVTRYVS